MCVCVVSSVMDWQPVQDVLCLSPCVIWERLQPKGNSKQNKKSEEYFSLLHLADFTALCENGALTC